MEEIATGHWRDFYMLIGQISATLTGLMFIAASLAAPHLHADSKPRVRSFLTPTIRALGMSMVLSAVMVMPRSTGDFLTLFLVAGGMLGCTNPIASALHLRERAAEKMPRSHWFWHVWLPILSYATILLCAVGVYRDDPWWPRGLAVALLLLLFVSLRNAWKATLFFAMND